MQRNLGTCLLVGPSLTDWLGGESIRKNRIGGDIYMNWTKPSLTALGLLLAAVI